MARPLPKRGSPGEFGEAVVIQNPSKEESKLIEKGWERQGFNEHVCDQISLHRNLGDHRENMCMQRTGC